MHALTHAGHGHLALVGATEGIAALLFLEPPSNRAWGVRAAYVQGPGRLKFEIEEPPK